MSATIDQKVVEMRFDNQNFEKNVSTTMNSIDKLKKSLSFDGIADGLDGIGKEIGKIDFSPMGTAVSSIGEKFSALETIAVGALLRIGSQAVDAGEKLIASLSVDQIASGWQKFSDKTTSVGTLIAQGYSMDEVSEQLERLNWFTDETSYNFVDMVGNIGKFTASGKDLKESVTAMEGIANWAALSGQNANTASRAMYQISQAMGAGIMRKEDYRSIQNASMDTEEFRQKALDAAVALGTLRKNADGTYHSLMATGNSITDFSVSQFADHLTQDAWFTSDVMMKVFNDYSSAVDQIYDYSSEHNLTASESISELNGQIDEFGLKAFKAAQEARTLEDAIGSVKDAASTAWMNTFELIIGDYEHSKVFFTDLANNLYDVFAEPINEMNEQIDGAMSSGWSKFLGDAVADSAAYKQIFTEVAKEHGIDVDKLIEQNGSFEESLKSGWLTANLMAEGVSRLNNTIQAGGEDLWEEYGLTKEDAARLDEFAKSFETDMRKIDASRRMLNADSESVTMDNKTKYQYSNGTQLEAYAEMISASSGRDLLIESFWNTFNGINNIINAIKEALPELESSGIYDFLLNLRDATAEFSDNTELGSQITRIVKGIGSGLNIISGALTAIWDGLKPIRDFASGALNDGIEAVASFGDYLVKLERSEKTAVFFTTVSEKLSSILEKLLSIGEKVYGFIDKIITAITGSSLSEIFSLDTLDSTIETIQNGIIGLLDLLDQFLGWVDTLGSEDSETTAGAGIIEFITRLKDAFADFNFDDIFNSGSGLFNAIVDTISKIGEALFGSGDIVTLFEKLASALGSIFGVVSTEGSNAFDRILDFLKSILRSIRDNVGEIVTIISEIVSNVIDAISNNIPMLTESLKGFLMSVVSSIRDALPEVVPELVALITDLLNILTEQIPSFIGAFVDFIIKVISNTIDAIVSRASEIVELAKKVLKVVAGVFVGLGLKSIFEAFSAFSPVNVLESFSDILEGISDLLSAQKFKAYAESIQSVAISILAVAAALFIIANIPMDKLQTAAIAVATTIIVLLVSLEALMSIMEKHSKNFAITATLIGLGVAFVAFATAVLILVPALMLLGTMNLAQIGTAFLAILVPFVAFVAAAKLMEGSIPGMLALAASFLIFSAALLVLAPAILLLSSVSDILTYLGVLLVTMVSFVGLGYIAQGAIPGLIALSTTMVIFAAALLVLGPAVIMLSSVTNIATYLGVLLITLVSFVGLGFLAQAAIPGLIALSLTLLIFAAALVVLAPAVLLLSSVGNIATYLGVLLGTLISFVGLGVIAQAAIPGLIALSTTLVIFAAALLIMAPAIVTLGSMDMMQVVTALVALAGTIIIFSVAAAFAAGLAVPLLTLSGVLIALGAGGLAAGIGLTALSVGVLAFSVALVALVAAIIASITLVVTAILTLGEAIVKAFMSFFGINSPSTVFAWIGDNIVAGLIKGLGDGVKGAVDAIVNLGASILQGFKDFFGINSPSYEMEQMGGFLTSGLTQGIENGTSDASNAMTDAGSSIFDKLQDYLNFDSGSDLTSNFSEGAVSGLGDYSSILNTSGINFGTEGVSGFGEIMNFDGGFDLSGLFGSGAESGLGSNLSGLFSAGSKAGQSGVDGTKSTMGYNKGEDIGVAFDQGLAKGLETEWALKRVAQAGKKVGQTAANATKETLEVHSPSRVGILIGQYFDEGIILGLQFLANDVGDAGSSVGNSAIEGLSNSLSDMSKLVMLDQDSLSPTITPIVDLDRARNSLDEIGRMFNAHQTFKMAYDAAEASYGKVSMQSLINGLRDDLETVLDGNNNENVVTAVRELRGDINELNSNISNTKIVLDDGTLVGKMAGKMDSALGARVRLSRRGV